LKNTLSRKLITELIIFRIKLLEIIIDLNKRLNQPIQLEYGSIFNAV